NIGWITAAVLSTCVASASSAATLEVEPGSSIYYVDEGKGTPIMFVPGWTMTSEVFVKQQAAFAKTHRVIVLDPRGQGRSSKDGSQHTYVQQGHDIDKLIQHLGVDKIVPMCGITDLARSAVTFVLINHLTRWTSRADPNGTKGP
ncbi:MAG: alpha/beta hydrolase, partial [Deltaproteobacteria bacterium]|nr:alpha/beta hydrolase [Deltaproteobacteria bacterium]